MWSCRLQPGFNLNSGTGNPSRENYVDGLRGGAIAAPSNTVQLTTSPFQNVAALVAPQLAWQVCTALI